jgi:hypothetical protein
MESWSGILQDALQHLPLVKNGQLNHIDEENAGANSFSTEYQGFRLDKANDKRYVGGRRIKASVDL